MSKILDQLKSDFGPSRKMPNHKLRLSDYTKTNIEWDINIVESLYEYKIEVILGHRGFCKRDDIGLVYETVYKELKNELYSDISGLFRKLQIAYYNDDRKEIDVLFREIGREIT